MTDFLLASRSPRRVEFLKALGYVFESVAADLPEQARPGQSAREFACEMALAKARHVQRARAGQLPVLGADTDVAVDGWILGKPRDREDALRMLAALSDRIHEVASAVALVRGREAHVRWTVTEVEFGPISAGAAAGYWDSGEPADKAGAYAIQGLAARWVKAIRGSYTGVVGLPLYETCELLTSCGVQAGRSTSTAGRSIPPSS
jgi:septum formation protein